MLPQDVPEGIYEVVYESTNGEKIIRYFEVGPSGSFIGQSNTKPELAKTGTSSTTGTVVLAFSVLALIGGAVALYLGRRGLSRKASSSN